MNVRLHAAAQIFALKKVQFVIQNNACSKVRQTFIVLWRHLQVFHFDFWNNFEKTRFHCFFFYFSGVRTLYWKKMRTNLHDPFWTLKLVIYSPLFIFRKRKKTDLLLLHFFGVTFIVTRTHITTVYHYFSFLFFLFTFVYLYWYIWTSKWTNELCEVPLRKLFTSIIDARPPFWNERRQKTFYPA